MNNPILERVTELINAAPPAFLNRYLSAVAVASLLYDHIRTLDTEVSDVWSSLSVSRGIKLGFLLGRYAADAALLYSAYALSGGAGNLDLLVRHPLQYSLFYLLKQPWDVFHFVGRQGCKIWLGTFWAAEAFCTATTEGIVIYRLTNIWGRRQYSLYLIPFLLFCMSVIMISLEIPRFYITLEYIPEWHTCATLPLTPYFTIVQYTSLALTDIIVVLLFITSVLEIPYKQSSEVIAKLEKDGGWYFLALFVIHFGCILVLALGKSYFPVALPLVWAFTMIINSRIFHRIGLDKKHADETVLYRHRLSLPQLIRR